MAAVLSSLACLAALPGHAATFKTLHAFRGGDDGASPHGRPLIGKTGLIYGTTLSGGNGNGGSSAGTVFQLDPATGIDTILYNFTLAGPTGSQPAAGLIADAKGNLYGTTESGGNTAKCSSGCGVVFRLAPSTGKLTVMHSFSGLADGREPQGALVFGPDGKLYGTTELGGSTGGNCGSLGCGTIFQLDPGTAALVTLHGFAGSPGDGAYPVAGLVFDSAGVLYGTTTSGSAGGNDGSGTVFSLNPATSAYTVLHFFDYHTDGSAPSCTLAFMKGVLYGTTAFGGPTAAADGTVFKIDTTSGAVTTLYSFQGAPGDGERPTPGVMPGKHGTLLGTTEQGGSSGSGTIYTLNPVKLTYKLLHDFADASDGAIPAGGLAVAKNGIAYGVTSFGNGEVFSITP